MKRSTFRRLHILLIALLLACSACAAPTAPVESATTPPASTATTLEPPASTPPETTATTSPTAEPATSATTEPTTPATTTISATEPPATTLDLYALEWTQPTDTNAAEPLEIRTYDGFHQPCHPKVLYFENKWNGYHYWMAYTPYPYCADLYENPCLAVSDDGVNWTEPAGIRNPVTGVPPTHENSAHYSDPHLLMNGETMELWFRYNPSYGDGVNADSNEGIILRTCSEDGIHWTEPEQLYQNRAILDPVLSPIVMLSDGVYTMWYARRDGCLYRTQSEDAHTWTTPEKTDLVAPNSRIWHQDMIQTDLGYEIVFCARPKGTQSNLHGLSLYYAASTDGMHFTDPVLIVSPRTGTDAFDNASIYRASILKTDGVYRIYYSSMSERYVWKISLCEGASISELKGMGIEP